jgi:phospholipid transport system substrate-binding protein
LAVADKRRLKVFTPLTVQPRQVATMSKTPSQRLWAVGIAGFLLIRMAALPCEAAVQDPASFIQDLGSQAIRVAGPSVPPAQRALLLRQLLERDFDLPDAAKFVLGPRMRELSPEQQHEFMVLFRDSVAAAYGAKLGQYSGEPFNVTGTHQIGGETVVTSQVVRSGQPVELDWHVIDNGSRFLVTDVTVDGVSQRASERTEFAGIIQRNGGRTDALLAAMRQQLQSQMGSGS